VRGVVRTGEREQWIGFLGFALMGKLPWLFGGGGKVGIGARLNWVRLSRALAGGISLSYIGRVDVRS
jgi:hypothetical protein